MASLLVGWPYPLRVRLRILTLSDGPALMVIASVPAKPMAPSAPAQSIVMDLVIMMLKKSNESTQLTSPPALASLIARSKLKPGASRWHELLSLPVLATQ